MPLSKLIVKGIFYIYNVTLKLYIVNIWKILRGFVCINITIAILA